MQVISKNNEEINIVSNNLTSDKLIGKSLDIKNGNSIKTNIDNNGNITTLGKVSSTNIELNNSNGNISSLKYNDKLILSSDDKEVDIISGSNNILINPNSGIIINGDTTFNNNIILSNMKLNNKIVNDISTSSSSVSTNKDNNLTTQGYVDDQISSFDSRLTNDETTINNISAQISSI